jgi:thiol:disulfide interchange protein|tara:strand:+ start:257 stop:2017 length:1761 start_codon:yes stop_codon:yes gene_type:complete
MLIKHIQCLIFAFLLLLSFGIAAQVQNPFTTSTPQQSLLRLPAANEFLPVEQAYQLNIDINKRAVLLSWDIKPGYYLYKNRFAFSLAEDNDMLTPIYLTDGKVIYDDYFEKELEVFYDLAEVEFDRNILSTGTLKVSSQGCADAGLCYPPQNEFFHIDVNTGTVIAVEQPSPQTKTKLIAPNQSEDSKSLWLALILAIAGGSLLNLMPCVFPVLSIKALSLTKNGGNNLVAHGWTYTAGAVTTFVGIAAAMLLARTSGEAIGWGFQLQSPFLIALLAYLFFAMGLSLSGLASFGSRLMGAGQSLTGGHGLRSSFFTGALATVVASPCTAPFMATALGYALTQPPAVALLVFAALGFGMALPFLLLCCSPKLAQKLPQPGAWMDTLKQFLAFPLYLSAIWLLWVLGRQAGSDAMALATIGLLLIAFALWLTHLPERTVSGHRLRYLTAFLCIGAALVLGNKLSNGVDNSESIWQPYSRSSLVELQNQQRPVFINLTADWCLTCLANEKLTLDTDELEALFTEHKVAALKGDWTNYNAEITELLEEYQRSGVPLYLYYSAGESRATVLPQLLLLKHIETAIGKTANPQ